MACSRPPFRHPRPGRSHDGVLPASVFHRVGLDTRDRGVPNCQREWCVLAGPPERTRAQVSDLLRQHQVSLGQEAGGGSGSAEAGTTAVPGSRDREVTTHLRLDSPRRVTGRWPAVHRPPGLCAVQLWSHRVLAPAPDLGQGHLTGWVSLLLPAGCWESGKHSAFTLQIWRHMGRQQWMLGVCLMRHHTTQGTQLPVMCCLTAACPGPQHLDSTEAVLRRTCSLCIQHLPAS